MRQPRTSTIRQPDVTLGLEGTHGVETTIPEPNFGYEAPSFLHDHAYRDESNTTIIYSNRLKEPVKADQLMLQDLFYATLCPCLRLLSSDVQNHKDWATKPCCDVLHHVQCWF